jgi:DNA-binding response OmpR family regulator
MRVLIVDDDSGIRRLLQMVLMRDGHETDSAGDGLAGWRELARDPLPHLLILDRMLPDLDGADFLARLRDDARTASLPVLVLTASARTSGDLDDGALTRVLAKPFDLTELRELMSALVAVPPAAVARARRNG